MNTLVSVHDNSWKSKKYVEHNPDSIKDPGAMI